MAASLDNASILVLRGDYVESRHRVAFVIARADGAILAAGGDTERPILPRSAIKPLQALPLLTSGAADAAALSDAEIALACGSHGGRAEHVATVQGWLRRLDLPTSALRCGAHLPADPDASEAMLRAGVRPSALHNNCSGKHAGMLTLARHGDSWREDYRQPDHPVQTAIATAIRAMTGLPDLPLPAIDGCGVPTWPLPLAALAQAMARMADPAHLEPPLARAAERVRTAMRRHPTMIAGPGRLCTEIGRVSSGILAKTGAEGVYAAILPDARLGVALKVEDGAARAAGVALLALLEALGVLHRDALARLAKWHRPLIRNHAGTVVGRIEPVPGWPNVS